STSWTSASVHPRISSGRAASRRRSSPISLSSHASTSSSSSPRTPGSLLLISHVHFDVGELLLELLDHARTRIAGYALGVQSDGTLDVRPGLSIVTVTVPGVQFVSDVFEDLLLGVGRAVGAVSGLLRHRRASRT